MTNDNLDKFINEIIELSNLSTATPGAKTILLSDLKERLLDQINRAIIDAMDDTQVDNFNKFLDEGEKTDEEVQQFVSSLGIDSKIIVARTLLRFRDLYLNPSDEQKA